MSVARSSVFRRLSGQLPLAIAALLLAVVAVISWASYREARHAALAAAGDRLGDAAARLAELSAPGLRQRVAETVALARDPDVMAVVAGADGAAPDRARAALTRLSTTNDQIAAVELWDPSGTRVLSAGRPGSGEPPVNPEFPGEWVTDTAVISGIRRTGDVAWYEIAAVVATPGGRRGYVVQVRRVAATQQATQAARVIGGLIGTNASMRVGQPGGLWTDGSRLTDGPPLADSGRLVEYRDDAGVWNVGVGRPVPGSSWWVWIQFPRDLVLARANAFLRRMAPAAGLVVVLGVVAGWALSRRVTAPLGRVRAAATAMASGDLAQQVAPGGPGELRELGEAFNAMARRIGAAHQELEGQVAERTKALWRYATDLEAANRELEAFSYSVSHDLRAPLRAIHGFSQAVMDDAGDRLDAQGLDHLRRVRAAADRMAVLIDDLLELSRVARTEMRAEPVDLSQLAHKVAAELRQGHGSRDVEVRIADGLTATGDQRLLRLALQNLLDNAWKFTSKRPQATVEVGTADGTERVFFVRDNGAGFDMTYADKLFGVFQRLHTPNEFPGTGVGLAIVQRVVHRHGGRVWAEGAPDRGATFYFTLPGSEPRGMEA
jgi:signal transduction histidine kinase